MNPLRILETERLYLNKFRIQDWQCVIDILNSPKWLKYIGDREIKTKESSETYLQNYLIKGYDEHGFGQYKMEMKNNGESVGMCGILKRNYLKHPDIGFALIPKYEGLGLAYEASKKVLKYAQDTLGHNIILAITHEENLASQNLCKKLGLKFWQKIKIPGDEKESLIFSTEI